MMRGKSIGLKIKKNNPRDVDIVNILFCLCKLKSRTTIPSGEMLFTFVKSVVQILIHTFEKSSSITIYIW